MRATALTASITHGFLSANPGCVDMAMPHAVDCETKHGMPPRRRSPPSMVEGGWENTKLARKGGSSSVMVLTTQQETSWARVPSTLLVSPPCSVVGGREGSTKQARDRPSSVMALTTQQKTSWAREPSTHPSGPEDLGDTLVPTAPKGPPKDWCSPRCW